jgi:PD-(D/E)XK endonuclease
MHQNNVPNNLANTNPSQVATLHACADRTRKSYGEASEAAFLARACALGFSVATPWGDSNRYDLLLDTGRRLWRVQVKSSQRFAEGRYRVSNTGSGDQLYSSDEIDFIAAHVVPLDLWYIVPIAAIGSSKGLRFYPYRHSRGRLEKYREAWCLFACEPQTLRGKARGWRDLPVLCRSPELQQHCERCPLLK